MHQATKKSSLFTIKLIFFFLISIQTLDLGQIAYFEKECPIGWEPYLAAQQKFILAAGKRYKVGEIGGFESITLSESQMPRHNHHNSDVRGLYNGLLTSNCYSTRISVDTTCNGQPNLDSMLPLKDAGNGQPHSNMPPYIVLNACKRIADSSSDMIQNLKIANEKIQQLWKQIVSINTTNIANEKIQKDLTEKMVQMQTNFDNIIKGSQKDNFASQIAANVLSGIAIIISIFSVWKKIRSSTYNQAANVSSVMAGNN